MTTTAQGGIDLTAQAWDWVLRLQDESVTQEDLVAWLQWYESDERHKAAFDDMQSFWQQIDRVTDDPEPLTPELWLGAKAVPAAERAAMAPHSASSPRLRRRRASMLVWGMMAASICAGVVGAWVWLKLLGPSAVDASRLAQAAPEAALVRENYLPDGSKVELAAKSSVAVEYSEHQRLLDLKDGEAFFSVAHNKARPFVVEAGKLRVRAVGTAFNVRRAGDRVVVTVSEGTVDVYPQNGDAPVSVPGAGAVRVSAGSEVAWSAEGPVIAAVDPEHALAWRQGRLEYLNEPLDSAIADINRYSSRRVRIGDPAVGRLVVSGTIMTGAADAWLRALPSLFPVDLLEDGQGGLVLVTRDQERSPPLTSMR